MMTLDQLIEELSKRDGSTVVRHGFGRGHSDRGNYSNAAFDPVEETTIGEMLKNALALLGTMQHGYKGGEYLMAGYVDVCIGEWGECGDKIGRHHFLYWDTFAPNPRVDRAGDEAYAANNLLREAMKYIDPHSTFNPNDRRECINRINTHLNKASLQPNPPGSPGEAPVHPVVGRMQDQPDNTKQEDK
jgi:hypothetical protein